MINYIDHTKMGRGIHGWLDSHFHFSFAGYYNPQNIQFGVLRVVNDDVVQPGTGFDTHPHEDMEIISYVVKGELSHRDSMGNERTLRRGQVQYMSAGTGVSHSEYNHGRGLLRFFQIWIFPDQEGLKPNYGDFQFDFEERRDRWLALAGPVGDEVNPSPVKIHADVNVYATVLSPGCSIGFSLGRDRQAYLVLAEGEARIEGGKRSAANLAMRDAAEIAGEGFTIKAGPGEDAHILLIEMPREAV